MSDTKQHLEHVNDNGHGTVPKHLQTVTLTPEQFEALYMQPRDPRVTGGFVSRLGNPTPLGVSSFLLALMPLSMDLLNFQGSTTASGVAMLGAFYGCAGIGLYLASIMEWIIGNTFPSVVFGTFGGFWIAYAIIIQPSMGIAASFATADEASNSITAAAAGAATQQYNSGLGLYFTVWAILCAIYFVASLRTNVPFALIFFCLIFTFGFISAGYFHIGQGNIVLALRELKAAGAFAFVVSLSGIYIDIVLLLGAVQFPLPLPIFDLSTWFLVPKSSGGAKEHEA